MSPPSLRVRDAGRADMEAVLRESHAVWGDGMSVDDYLAFNLEQKATAWGRERYRFLVGADETGAVACGLKLYTLPGELDGRPIQVAGVGAVFTLPSHRGRGLGSRLVEAAMASAGAAGHHLILLMSEIGADYYERLGFRALPALEAGCLPFLPVPWEGEPDWVRGGNAPGRIEGLRPFQPADLEPVFAIHDEATRGQRLRLVRDRPAWEQALLRTALGHRLRRDGADLFWVIERAGEILAYAILKEARAALLWKEHGARLGSEEVLGDLFWAALAHARGMGVNRIDAWHLPAEVTTKRLYPIAFRPLRDPAIMIRRPAGAGEVPAFAAPEECRMSWFDIF